MSLTKFGLTVAGMTSLLFVAQPPQASSDKLSGAASTSSVSTTSSRDPQQMLNQAYSMIRRGLRPNFAANVELVRGIADSVIGMRSASKDEYAQALALRVAADVWSGDKVQGRKDLARFDRDIPKGSPSSLQVNNYRHDLDPNYREPPLDPRYWSNILPSDTTDKDTFWKTADPQKLGLSLKALKLHRDLCQRSGADAYLVVYKGHIVDEGYSHAYTIPMYTMSSVKSIVSLLTGMLIADEKIRSVDQPVSDFLPDWNTGSRAKVTLRMLLTMTAGFRPRHSVRGPGRSVGFVSDKDAFVAGLRPDDTPGTVWNYSNEDAQILSPILDQAAGEPIQNYAYKRLFTPLGMRHTYLSLDNEGHTRTYADAATSLRDFARIGQLMLNDGKWKGRQIVPTDWIRKSLKPSLNEEYGYLWWLIPQFHGFAMEGYLDTSCYCLPDIDLEVVRMQSRPSRSATVPYMPNALRLYQAIVPHSTSEMSIRKD